MVQKQVFESYRITKIWPLQAIYFLILLVVSSCSTNNTNALATNYRGYTQHEIMADSDFLLDGTTPVLYSTTDFERDSDKLARDGFVMSGSTSYYGQNANVKHLKAFAKSRGAQVILERKTLAQSTANTIDRTPSTGNTSYDTGASVGWALSQSLMYMMHGTHTNTYRSDYAFFIKRKALLGVKLSDISPQARTKSGLNRGAYVSLVVNNSKALTAGIREGDIFTHINDVEVYNAQHCLDTLAKLKDQAFDIQYFRYGEYTTVHFANN